MNSSNSSSEWKIPLYKIYTDDEDLNLITKIVKRGTFWSMGPEIDEFENSLKNYVGCEYCLSLNSGTSALHTALLANDIGSSNEVIVPSFSFIATANSVLYVNSKPVFVDIEEENFGLDPDLIPEKISKSTKAIIPMDYGGLPCKILDIKKIADENNLVLIEDAAEVLGSSINGKKIGSISDTTIFSFCGNKVLTTGEGGALLTNSSDVYEKAKLIRSHGRVDNVSYFQNPDESDYVQVGYNWRMSSITASLGISQLQKLDKLVDMRRKNAHYLNSQLRKHPEIKIPTENEGFKHVYQMYTIRLKTKQIRDSLRDFLLSKKIFCKIYFDPIHLKPYYQTKFNYKSGDLPITEKIANHVLTLPLYPNMTDEEKDYLTQSIDEFFEIHNKL